MRAKENVIISTEVIQLDQLIKWMGITETGGQARFLVDNGEVKVNGVTVIERRKKIYPGDCLMINGQEYLILQETE